MSIIQGNTKVSAGGYSIDQSIRFNDNDSAYLSRTSGATGDRQKWTFSAWVKRGNLSSNQRLFHDSGNTNFIMFGYSSNNEFRVYLGADIRTTALFRDPSAWYHLVVAVDTTQATSSDRVKIYQNGSQITSFSASGYPSLNYNTIFNNSGTTYQISGQSVSEYFDGYISEFHWIDGQALDPTDFGEYNDDGVWIPKAYAGTYGNNGFYLKGQDSAALGDDSSGNNNDFTSSGLTSDDQVADSPTENYCVISPLTGVNSGSSVVTQANGNLEATQTANYVGTFGTVAANSGKYYFEYSYAADGNYSDGRLLGGVVCVETADHGHFRIDAGSFYYPDKTTEGNYMVFHRSGNGQQSNTGTSTSAYNTNLSSSSATGGPESGPDIYMVAMDLDNDNLYWGKNGTWYGASSTSGSDYTDATPIAILSAHQGKYFAPAFYWSGAASGTTTVLNCGQDATFGGRYSSPAGDFYYTPPTGFSKLSTSNLATPTTNDGSAHFFAKGYAGTGVSGTSITNDANAGDFKPDLLIVTPRNVAENRVVFDSVRETTSRLYTNKTDAQDTDATALITFEANGFDLDTTDRNYNGSGYNYIAWQWHTTGGTSGSNTDGSITSTVSANTTGGISIIGYTGNATSGATIGHGLGVAPALVITKSRTSSSYHWYVYHQSNGATKYMRLNDTSAVFTDTNAWNDTAPTSSVITLGNSSGTNNSGDMIAYAFAEVEGFSKFGQYTGNGSSDGIFAYCGFRPAWVMLKRTNSADNWVIIDNSRDPYNVADGRLYPDLQAAEISSTTLDLVSNGFKLRASDGGVNGSGSTYIFVAFAENPFGGDGVAPVPAR